MDEKNTWILKSPIILYLSFFGIGFIKYAPGTLATLAGLPFLMMLSSFGPSPLMLLFLLLCLVFPSVYLIHIVPKKHHDPSWIVIDEVLGLGFAWVFLPDTSAMSVAALVILFRFFDIVKVFPANIVDRRVHHGIGVILDDVVSGLYAGLVVRHILHPHVFPLLHGTWH